MTFYDKTCLKPLFSDGKTLKLGRISKLKNKKKTYGCGIKLAVLYRHLYF